MRKLPKSICVTSPGILLRRLHSFPLMIPINSVLEILLRVVLGSLNPYENLSRPGAPRKTTAATDRYITRTAQSETRIPLAELAAETNCNVSERTVHRRLHESGIRKWRAVERPLLSKKRHFKVFIRQRHIDKTIGPNLSLTKHSQTICDSFPYFVFPRMFCGRYFSWLP